MRILVTGAAGFIGSHVAGAYQKSGHEVVGVDNLSTGRREHLSPGIALDVLDLRDESNLEGLFARFRPEVVNHHAAQANVQVSQQDPLDDARINILGSLALLRQAAQWDTNQIIYSSSVGVYGEPATLPVGEEHPIGPLSNYAVSKYTVELYLRSFSLNHGLKYLIFRYPNVYGPRQNPQGEAGVVAIFTTQLLRGVRPCIYGNGTKTRDYVYVDDIVEANLRALAHNECSIFNLGWGQPTTDWEVFEQIRNAVGCSAEPQFDHKRPGEIEHMSLDASSARNALGWRPRVQFKEGIRRVVEYWKHELRC